MIGLIITIAFVGCIVWAITTYIPMPKPFKGIIIVIAVIFLGLLMLRALGIDVDTSL